MDNRYAMLKALEALKEPNPRQAGKGGQGPPGRQRAASGIVRLLGAVLGLVLCRARAVPGPWRRNSAAAK